MKRYLIYIITIAFVSGACKKSSLELNNPNQPLPQQALTTQAGLQNFSLGILQKMIADVPGEGKTNIFHIALTNHSIMGDEAYVPYGNYGFRWVNQVYKITLPSGTVITNPNTVDQKTQLQGFDSRGSGELNAFQYEWSSCYYIISQANFLLASLNDPLLKLSGDADNKKNIFKAWGLWWKAYAYSRIGSMYLAGVIVDTAGKTNGTFVDHTVILSEADKALNDCLTTLDAIQVTDDYNAIMEAIIASFNENENIVTPDMWKRQIYSLKARNLMVNKKITEMTTTDWQQVTTLANQGIQANDNIFRYGMDPSGSNDVSLGQFHPYLYLGEVVQFSFVSERLIQDFKPGDNRLAIGFKLFSPPKVNERGRGLQFGTRYNPIFIEDGGLYATGTSSGTIPWACSYEETQLMKAEALLRTGSPNAGLLLVDAVRDFQNSGLPHVSGTGLNATQALEEFRKERRVALFLWGTAFYDARRWGVTKPASQGGGRSGAIVIVPGNLLTPQQAGSVPTPCFMEYNYMDYWDVPQNEIDFNTPGSTSPPLKN
ncbi:MULTISPECIES: RagB/SusD family nutrient uptake outer membrane protein [Niastella]|uniref:RagB/SusD family nutrient uptake outer membrane protein n=1 Tax=Niastella soli TaxID=2821487 RepID=A0ABS3YSV4_9BACT|nr:RagB/SusD family nutrient uptake outer membrane protein [Niastella soli]MBO9201002.1 RagB/SusD family nutrient uptake outer membrane protein [Niastella soli]